MKKIGIKVNDEAFINTRNLKEMAEYENMKVSQ